MLNLLKIRNLALVDELVWELGPGLVGVTGETGAGKSVIVGALKLVLGERADKSLIRTGEDACTVEAVFQLRDAAEADAVLAEGGLEPCEDGSLIVRRVIGLNASRQFVNDSPVTLGLLKRLGEHLVDLHGPHDHQSLLSTERQLSMLDAYAGSDGALDTYRRAWRAWRDKIAELDDLRSAESASNQELELLRHQVDEIDAAQLKPEEEDEIADRYRRASNATRLVELSAAAASALGVDESGVLARLVEVQRWVRDLEKLDPGIRDRTQGLEAAVMELQELERSLADYAEELDIDPAEAQRLERRVNVFETLKRKYGADLTAVIAHRDRAAARLDAVENRGERLEQLGAEVDALREATDKAGLTLGAKRKKAAPKLAKEIADQLKDLGFKQSSFELRIQAGREPGAWGLESVEFLFGPNPGEPLQPLRQIASSGEISRVMLAVKSALAEQDATPLMVFDEIDANVGGEIARAVGKKMAGLGARHQVVAITHFPQVAALAARHYVVEKEVAGGRTRSRLYPVAGEGRIAELVRMLGGGGESARAMAASLLAD
ncbi:MAG: DNA repair protein RecN [Verrucomicrobia bacterium]|nr:MAG: DNA repair protein RecN [Verrucomicrobiota bacterium]TAE89173.1 MAG: DNA repair protein RecN [Verrucomicrobiota bacterium]TAF27951.1 MAG: DNA repair protein RecN [Verrucomicrobiota bacterium]TAF42936.1 MAG: DNA repair protein RecN [Verrucomicrobiota bacterium]